MKPKFILTNEHLIKNNAGASVSAGLYFYTIQAGKFSKTNKMLLLK